MINFCKNFILYISIFFFPQVVLAQDTIFQKSNIKITDTLETTVNTIVQDSVKNEITNSSKILLDSISIKNAKKIDKTTSAESLPNEKLDLSSVGIYTDFENGISDHPSLKDLDAHWREELFGNSLFDSIYSVVQDTDYTKIEYVADLPTDVLKERLKTLNAKTPFNVEYNLTLESVIKNFLKNRHQSLTRLMALSDYYFPLFEQVLDKYDLPLEIKYLAIVESALKPRVKSRVGATGLWQFMYGTGKMYGLDVNSYVDERMDPIEATEAAAKYLSKLYNIFGDWDLALASYNSGPGNVTKAIRRSGGYTNFWNIRDFLPRETAGYVPLFLATMYVFEYAHKHDFKPKRVKNAYFTTDTVKVKQQITLDQIAEVIDLKVEVLQFLNPQYKLGVIPFIKKKDYVLRLPSESVGTFVSHESAIYAKAKEEFDKREKPLPQIFEEDKKVKYRVRNGDYLGLIAKRYGVRVSQIKQWNGLRNNNIGVGKYLTIYPRRKGNYTKAKTQTTPKPTFSPGTKIYKVRSGDSLWSIAQKNPGVSVSNLKQWNEITSSKLKPGMVLKLEK